MGLFAWRRFAAVLTKEFVQVRRDRLTFAMMIGVPVMQLVLFGYAINMDPKGLPAAVVQAWEQAVQKVMAKPEYRQVYESDTLIPAYRNQKEAREFTHAFAKDVATSLRELGVIK